MTTRLMPLHTGKGRTVGTAITDILDYVENPQKTAGGRLITGFQCDNRVADAEFLFSKRQYAALTGRARGEDDVIAYHVRHSFAPGEVTPEEANRIGVEFAKRFTKGNHAFIVCTHIDREHIHNHIIEHAALLAEKKEAYGDYRKARDKMKELLTVKANVDRLMGYDEKRAEQEKDQSQAR